MNCSTTTPGGHVDWEYLAPNATTSPFRTTLFSGLEITESRRERFSITGDASSGEFDLKIVDVNRSDDGTYFCVANGGYGPDVVVTILSVAPRIGQTCTQ